jgi:tripartite-type tricarboxylate transporter receptor subunit TctC
MKLLFSPHVVRAVLGIAISICSVMANAQSTPANYPAKLIKMTIGFSAGGPTDVVARILSQRLSEKLGQPVVVDNRPGAGSNIAASLVAKDAADGYSLLYNTSSITIAPWTYGKVGYDPVNDFTPVLLTAEMPLVLVVNRTFPAKTAREFVDNVKAHPGLYNYGSSGSGAIEHLTSAQFMTALHLEARHVSYKGTAPALVDLLGGQTQFMMTTLNTALPYIRDGRLTALAVTSKKRTSVLPSVPTVSEALSINFESTAWQGIVLPAKAALPIVRKLNETLNAILQEEGVRQKLAQQGVDVLGGTPEQYAAFIKSEYSRWENVVKKTGAGAE